MTTSAIAPTVRKRFKTDDGFFLPEPTRLEKAVGPEWARVIRGLLTNPLSVTGLVVVFFFLAVAAAAPVLAPPVRANANPYLIPRDGFGPTPNEPGTEWSIRAAPPVPFWYETVTGNEEWVHLMGTTSGQFDIYYGIVWGTRTALLVGVLVVGMTLFIGLIVGSISGYYGGFIDDLLMRSAADWILAQYYLGDAKRVGLQLALRLIENMRQNRDPLIIAIAGLGWAIQGEYSHLRTNIEFAISQLRGSFSGNKLPEFNWYFFRDLLPAEEFAKIEHYFEVPRGKAA